MCPFHLESTVENSVDQDQRVKKKYNRKPKVPQELHTVEGVNLKPIANYKLIGSSLIPSWGKSFTALTFQI